MFDWNDFLGVAARLAEDGDEATHRTAINRAYYAVYHAASRLIRTQALVPVSQRLSHSLVWTTLQRDSDATKARIGRRGDQLRELRVAADYHDQFGGELEEVVSFAIAESAALLEDIRELQTAESV